MKKALLILPLTLVLFGCGNYSNGNRAGSINKFSQKGLICKTWEGELALGGYVNGENGTVANVWNFSVEDQTIVDQLNAAQEAGKRVRLTYRQELIASPCRSDTVYFVTKVEVL